MNPKDTTVDSPPAPQQETQRPSEDAPGTSFLARCLSLRVLAVVAMVVSSLLVGRFLWVANQQLSYPFDFCWESPNLSTIAILQQHRNPYAPSTYAEPPFVLTPYTPLYHYLASFFPLDEHNPFFYGRLISLLAFLGLGVFLGGYNRGRLPIAFRFGLAAAYLSTWPVMCFAAYLKNESLGVLFAAGAMLLAMRSRSWLGLSVAALLAVAAPGVKQTFVAGGLAAAIYLFAENRQAFLKFSAMLLFWGAVAAMAASLCFGAGFWFATSQSLQQPFDFTTGISALREAFSQPLALVLAVSAAIAIGYQTYSEGVRRTLRTSPWPAYYVLTLLICVTSVWKLGAATNYFFEFFLASCFVLSDSACRVDLSKVRSRAFAMVVGCLCLSGISDLLVAHPLHYNCFANDLSNIARAEKNEEYRQLVRQCGIEHPRILNIATHLHIFTLGPETEPSFNDPWLYRNLWDANVLSPQPLLDAIRRQDYDVVIVPISQGEGVAKPFPPPPFTLTGFVGPLQQVDRDIQSALADRYRPFAVGHIFPCQFFVRNGRQAARAAGR